jgi:hypothetical protein
MGGCGVAQAGAAQQQAQARVDARELRRGSGASSAGVEQQRVQVRCWELGVQAALERRGVAGHGEPGGAARPRLGDSWGHARDAGTQWPYRGRSSGVQRNADARGAEEREGPAAGRGVKGARRHRADAATVCRATVHRCGVTRPKQTRDRQ